MVEKPAMYIIIGYKMVIHTWTYDAGDTPNGKVNLLMNIVCRVWQKQFCKAAIQFHVLYEVLFLTNL